MDSHTARPNPDELLKHIQADEQARQRGKLKIFLGYAAGVGKTYAMLEAARQRKREGVDVVIGYVETHKRAETEVMVRMRVAIRRLAKKPDEPVLQVDELKMDLSCRLVTVNDKEISLTPTEYDILRLLLQTAGKVLTHRHLLRQVWGTAYESEMHLLRVNISNLRRKIESDAPRPHYLLTESGVGYRLRADE